MSPPTLATVTAAPTAPTAMLTPKVWAATVLVDVASTSRQRPGPRDGRAVVDVGPLAARVGEDHDLARDGENPQGAGGGEPEERLGEGRVDADRAAGADPAGRGDAGVGGQAEVDDADARTDGAETDRGDTGDADHAQQVDRADLGVLSGVDAAVDGGGRAVRRRRLGEGRRRDGAGRLGGGHRVLRVGGLLRGAGEDVVVVQLPGRARRRRGAPRCHVLRRHVVVAAERHEVTLVVRRRRRPRGDGRRAAEHRTPAARGAAGAAARDGVGRARGRTRGPGGRVLVAERPPLVVGRRVTGVVDAGAVALASTVGLAVEGHDVAGEVARPAPTTRHAADPGRSAGRSWSARPRRSRPTPRRRRRRTRRRRSTHTSGCPCWPTRSARRSRWPRCRCRRRSRTGR